MNVASRWLVAAAWCLVIEAEADEPPRPLREAPAAGTIKVDDRVPNGVVEVFVEVDELLLLDEADDGEMPRDPRQAQLWQQRKQIREHAKHLEQAFQPALRTELEMIRRSCGSLSSEARREVLAAGRAAVTKTALAFATWEIQGGAGSRDFDAQKGIQEPLAQAVEPLVSADEFATYQRQQRLRGERRHQAARIAIVSKLDRRLDLTEAQRRAIEVDLERHWEASWVRELDDRGVIITNERPAMDDADVCIAPHLDEAQKAQWQRWRKAAGSAVVGLHVHVGLNPNGQGLHQEDDWWTK